MLQYVGACCSILHPGLAPHAHVLACCSRLQSAAVCCSILLQHVTPGPSATRSCTCVLQYVAVCCSVLQCVAVCCSTLHLGLAPHTHVLACCSMLQYVAVGCRVSMNVAVCCNTFHLGLSPHAHVLSSHRRRRHGQRRVKYRRNNPRDISALARTFALFRRHLLWRRVAMTPHPLLPITPL